MKKKREGEKSQRSWLESLLRFEIVVLLFALIGFYCFLSFSPIRVSKKPLASPRSTLASLPPIPKAIAVVQGEVAQSVENAEFSNLSTGVVGSIAEPNAEFPVDGVPVTPVGSVVGETLAEPEPIAKLPLEDDVQKQKVVPSKVSDPLPAEVPAKTLVPVAAPAEVKVVEVGNYVLQADLQKFRTQLEELGFAVQSETLKRPTAMFRVFLGPYSDQRKVQKMMAEVRKMGDQPFSKTLDSGTVVVVGSFYLRASVDVWQNTYRAAGYDPKVQKENLMVPHTYLRLNGPRVVEDPEAVLAQVQAAGFSQACLKTISPTSAK